MFVRVLVVKVVRLAATCDGKESCTVTCTHIVICIVPAQPLRVISHRMLSCRIDV